MEELFKDVTKKMDGLHLGMANTVAYSPDPVNAQFDMMNQLFNQMPEGQRKKEMKKLMKNELDAMKEGKTELEQKLTKKAMVRGREEERYGDGDQSRVVGRAAQKLDVQWKEGMDYHPSNCSHWMRVIFFGDYNRMMAMLNSMAETQVDNF